MTDAYLGPPRRRRDPSPVIDHPRGLPADIQPALADEVVLPPAPGARDLGDPSLSRRARAAAALPTDPVEVDPPESFPSFDRGHERRRPIPAVAEAEPAEVFDLPDLPGARDLGDPRDSRRARDRKA